MGTFGHGGGGEGVIGDWAQVDQVVFFLAFFGSSPFQKTQDKVTGPGGCKWKSLWDLMNKEVHRKKVALHTVFPCSHLSTFSQRFILGGVTEVSIASLIIVYLIFAFCSKVQREDACLFYLYFRVDRWAWLHTYTNILLTFSGYMCTNTELFTGCVCTQLTYAILNLTLADIQAQQVNTLYRIVYLKRPNFKSLPTLRNHK